VLLRVENLVKHFPIRRGVFSQVTGYVRAVDGVSFTVGRGETMGLVGESGCGKTTVGRVLLRLVEGASGRVVFDGIDVNDLDAGELRLLRREMQVIFQDPFGSLDPRMTVGAIVGEGLKIHGVGNRRDRAVQVIELLERCGLGAEHAGRYPHEFSGGQRQRIGIARALALGPKLIVCDEPVSSLDVSIQAQITNLLKDLQSELGLSYIFIAHDLALVEHVSDKVAVMYLGKFVEEADAPALYAEPLHPYTRALMSAVPVPDPAGRRKRIVLAGDIPSPADPPPGCRFHTRCYLCRSRARCWTEEPELRELRPGHFTACHFAEELVDCPLGAAAERG
jgi:oligopeptide/dipeptide ABC transporter ATP-binding protein